MILVASCGCGGCAIIVIDKTGNALVIRVPLSEIVRT